MQGGFIEGFESELEKAISLTKPKRVTSIIKFGIVRALIASVQSENVTCANRFISIEKKE